MALDIDRRRWLLALLDSYAELLTEHQRETLNLHLERDWSYAEIADAHGVSRTAVYDLVHRSAAVLEDYEAKLGLHARVLTTIRGRGYRFDPGADVQYRALALVAPDL